MEKTAKPIFFTENPSRWNRFRWMVKILAVVLSIGLISIIFSLLHKQVLNIPSLAEHPELYRKMTNKVIEKDADAKEYLKLQKIINQARKTLKHEFYNPLPTVPGNIKKFYPVHAGFYVNWDVQAKYSLSQNISHLNMVLPEWFFIQDTSDRIYCDVDTAALTLMRRNHIAIVPMVSNYFNNGWNGGNVHRIITSPKRRAVLIESIVKVLHQYSFHGVNIDFEDLKETTDEYMIAFQKELYLRLHKEGFLVTQDIATFNSDYNLQELARVNDLLFLMAYDQHNAESSAGPIAAQYWLEASMDDVFRKIDPEKVVMCIAGYGYDWIDGFQGTDITYQEAISTALESDGKVIFDNKTCNLNYDYFDDNDVLHHVYFTDAASNFDAIRATMDNDVAGYALWRLGSEDSRLWSFFDLNLSDSALKANPFDYKKLENTGSSYNVDYVGAGEILNIVSTPQPGKTELEFNVQEQSVTEEKYLELPSSFVINKTGEKSKKIALTFDDGPDENFTPRILDILKEYHVPAAFFVTGINAEQNLPIIKRIYNEGHEIGNHTFIHPNLELVSADRLRLELRATGYIIEGITGHATMFFRPPYNTDAEPVNPLQIAPIAVAKAEGYLTIGSSIDPLDWQLGVSADSIIARAESQRDLGNIMLLHDAGGNRESTVKALPSIIEFYKKNGFEFVSVASLMDKKRDDVMPVEKGRLNRYLESADATVFKAGYVFNRIISALFFVALALSVFKILSVALFAWLQRRKTKKPVFSQSVVYSPKVSIIVPAYNEEITAPRTIENLLGCDYPEFEIIFVDDGSRDTTFSRVRAQYSENPLVTVLTKPNGGKASALNYGISHATGEILVCIDADTVLRQDALSKLIPFFKNKKVAAVAGNVKVGNKVNLLTRWQYLEYTTSQNFDRRAFDMLNAIMVVPGAIGAFRREAVLEAGRFTTDTLAEDCDLTMRLLRKGYRIHSCNEALAYTEVPETVEMLVKQRFRWTFGIMQSFWKHRDLMFTRRQTNMSWILLPHLLIYQLILPLFSPLVDITLLLSLLMPKSWLIIVLYFLYFLLDLVISITAFRYDGEKFRLRYIIDLFLQRIIYRQLLWFVLLKSYLRAMKGELAYWGFLKRTGNVEQVPE